MMQRALFGVLMLAVVAVNLPQSVVVPVLPALQDSYGTAPVTSTWLITGFLLSSGVATPLLARLGDRYGTRRILASVLAVLALGCLGSALAPTIGWQIAMRVLQGISGGAVPLAFSALRLGVPPEQLRYRAAVLATVGSIAFSVGIVLAGPILIALGRPALFLFPMVLALIAMAGVLIVLPRPVVHPGEGRFSVLSVLLFATALICVLLAISRSSFLGWTSPTVLALIGGGLLAAGAWARQERRARVPFIDLQMLRLRGIWSANLVAFLAGLGMFGCAAGLPRLIQDDLGAELSQVGLLMSPIALTAFFTSLVTGHLYRTFSARALLVAGGLISSIGFVGLALVNDTWWLIVGWCAVQGVGNGLLLSTIAAVVVASVPAEQTGVANGLNTNVRTLGGSLGAATTAAILTAAAGPGFLIAFAVLAVAMALAAGAALLIPGERAPSDLAVSVPP